MSARNILTVGSRNYRAPPTRARPNPTPSTSGTSSTAASAAPILALDASHADGMSASSALRNPASTPTATRAATTPTSAMRNTDRNGTASVDGPDDDDRVYRDEPPCPAPRFAPRSASEQDHDQDQDQDNLVHSVMIPDSDLPIREVSKLARAGPGGRLSVFERWQRLSELRGSHFAITTQSKATVITAPSESMLELAHDRLVQEVRSVAAYSHFVSIPLHDVSIVTAIRGMAERILRDPEYSRDNIEASTIVPPTQMHLSVGMLTLLNDAEERRAAQILERACQAALADAQLAPAFSASSERIPVITLRGMRGMTNDPRAMNVLYAVPEFQLGAQDGSSPLGLGASLLQLLASRIVAEFVASGLMEAKFASDLKLHATLINTKYRGRNVNPVFADLVAATTVAQPEPVRNNGKQRQHSKGYAERIPIDASRVMENFADSSFGSAVMRSIHLSKMQHDPATQYYAKAAEVVVVPRP
ncbi:hypothetical protein CAOG_07954 [Capsaspora owczarzaki ATCC 30864]|uniref:A-kinase anchor protein 7-like phosphoesterase domain-containing protein n=1 Tax=Capsaspora owczarzaki (strain ATCC 30864) TaxID=595528 RepID=A0A0D2WXG0_CAPO3|nr:hypothetical protein CAOG_07954 [Capsaspora owczarzaki ATCC 30864]KJE97875.1 hypothetical protein CAOG_007954 [Capsaspora owczarzaki ATCC 30864]|eukprot:XP_004343042.1 hypothetical protein CAOG_07954 [Capsaspora owczarzaki ATCC 30864]